MICSLSEGISTGESRVSWLGCAYTLAVTLLFVALLGLVYNTIMGQQLSLPSVFDVFFRCSTDRHQGPSGPRPESGVSEQSYPVTNRPSNICDSSDSPSVDREACKPRIRTSEKETAAIGNSRLQAHGFMAYYSQSVTDIPNTIQQHMSQVAQDQKEIQSLRQEAHRLHSELEQYKKMVSELKAREDAFKERVTFQAIRNIESSNKFEDLSMGSKRPSVLISQYSNLYTDGREEAYEALNSLPDMQDLHDLKGKLLFSVIVVSFKSVRDAFKKIWLQLNHLLSPTVPSTDTCPEGSTSENFHLMEVKASLNKYFKNTVYTYSVTKIVEEVTLKVFNTLYEYKSLQNCEELRKYIEECVRIAWSLSVQTPAYTIKYDCKTFDERLHTRFCSSDPDSQEIHSFLWPTLMEDGKECVHRGIVITKSLDDDDREI